MKKIQLALITVMLIGAVSCKKTDSTTTASATVTTDQAADMASGALATNSEGLATNFDDIATNAQTTNSVSAPGGQQVFSTEVSQGQACGTTRTDSTTRAGSSSSVTYSYFLKYSHMLNCNANNQHDNIVNTLSFLGSYDGPNITTADTGSSNFTIAGLTTTAASYVITGEYKRSGSFQSKIGNKDSGHSKIDIVVTTLTLTKSPRKIASGTGTISITGTWPKGSFSYTGTVKFNGDSTVTVVINGNTYSINLTTGVRTKQ